MDQIDLAWTAFRASLLAPLLTGEVTSAERGAYFHKLASQEHTLPSGKRAKISLRTLRRWYQQVREAGIDRLKPKPRSDRGQPRRIRYAKIQRAVELKREQPRRSDQVINFILKQEFGSGLASSTLYRHLAIQGATRKRLGFDQEKVRCRWTRDLPNSLWMGDFSHGPLVLYQGKPCQTYLSAWIDCHSRYMLDARFYLRENLDILVDSLLRALAKHGAPRELYTDNGKVYHSNGLVVCCAKLGISKLHRPPREPEPGGLIERFFQTVQSQFTAEAVAGKPLTFEQINQAFQAWLSSAYHIQVHSSTNQTPHSRYFTDQRIVRPVSISDVESYFYKRYSRRVDPSHSDVSIESQFYQVDKKLRGMQVEVQANPFRIDLEQPDEVKLYSQQGVYLGIGRRYDRKRGTHSSVGSEPVNPANKPLLDSVYIRSLLQDHEQSHEQARQDGIDYKSAMDHDRLTLPQLGQLFSHCMGQSGLSSLSQQELTALETFYRKHPQVRSWQVRRAFEQASGGGFLSTLWQLEQISSSKES